MNRTPHILVVGDVMLDRYIHGEVTRISPEAPVPVVKVSRQVDRLGGAANVAANIAALGAKVTLAGVVGSDESGRRVRSMAAEAGIATVLQTDAMMSTTVKTRVIGQNQQMLRMDSEGAPDAMVLKWLAKDVDGLEPDVLGARGSRWRLASIERLGHREHVAAVRVDLLWQREEHVGV